jgi:hypothetical protein
MNELKNKIESNMIQYPEALEYEYLLEKQNNKTTDKYEVWKTKITNEKEEEIRKKYNLQKQTTSLLTPAKTTDITTSGISGNNNKTSFDQLVKRATGGKKSTRRPRKNRRITKRKHIRRKK